MAGPYRCGQGRRGRLRGLGALGLGGSFVKDGRAGLAVIFAGDGRGAQADRHFATMRPGEKTLRVLACVSVKVALAVSFKAAGAGGVHWLVSLCFAVILTLHRFGCVVNI